MIDCLDFNAPGGKNLYQEIQQDNGDRYMVKCELSRRFISDP